MLAVWSVDLPRHGRPRSIMYADEREIVAIRKTSENFCFVKQDKSHVSCVGDRQFPFHVKCSS